MQLEIMSLQGAGPVKFGMSRAEVAHALGQTPHRCRKAPSSHSDTDGFDVLGIFVYYGWDDFCAAIEVPSIVGGSQLCIDGEALNGMPMRVAVKRLSLRDAAIEIDEAGATSRALGVGLFTKADPDSSEAVVDSVIAFRLGYYDER